MSSNIPLGAENDPAAPWNQIEQDEIKIRVNCTQSLTKDTEIYTSDYTTQGEYDEDDGFYRETYDIAPCLQDYGEQHYTPLELIQKLQSLCTKLLDKSYSPSKHELTLLIEECKGWEELELSVEEL